MRVSSRRRWPPCARLGLQSRLPFAELITGVLLPAGALTRWAAIAGGLVMIVLVLGATSIEHFNVIGDQLVHALFLVGVIAFRGHNRYSVDRLFAAAGRPAHNRQPVPAPGDRGVAISLNVPAECLPDGLNGYR